jgi:hypothetical protein
MRKIASIAMVLALAASIWDLSLPSHARADLAEAPSWGQPRNLTEINSPLYCIVEGEPQVNIDDWAPSLFQSSETGELCYVVTTNFANEGRWHGDVYCTFNLMSTTPFNTQSELWTGVRYELTVNSQLKATFDGEVQSDGSRVVFCQNLSLEGIEALDIPDVPGSNADLFVSESIEQPYYYNYTGTKLEGASTLQNHEINPCLSPDGSQVYFARRPHTGGYWKIWVTPMDEPQAEPLNNYINPGNSNSRSPHVFHDSGGQDFLYFASDRNGTYDIWVSQRIGNDWATPTQVGLGEVNSGANEIDPCVPPDGTLFCFSSDRDSLDLRGFEVYMSKHVDFTPEDLPSTAPGAPSFDINEGRVLISWNAVPGARGYVVYRREDLSTGTTDFWMYVVDGDTSVMDYKDLEYDSSEGNTRDLAYRVAAFNHGGFSEFSDESIDTLMQFPPSVDDVTASVQGDQIVLNWSKADSTSGYVVQRRHRDYNVDYFPVGDVDTFTDTTAKPGWNYRYIIMSYINGQGHSLGLQSEIVRVPEFIVDDSDPGFLNIGNKWDTFSGLGHKNTIVYTATKRISGSSAFAAWLVDVPAGDYEVLIRIPDSQGDPRLSTAVPLVVYHAGVETPVYPFDQRGSDGAWVTLGIFQFSGDGDQGVLISNDTPDSSTLVVGDAVGLQSQ